MEKRYQVFVSSTYDDLREERNEVMHALLELDCIPSGMELFPAADEDQWTLIQEVIDDCDYYVVIIGGKYGSMHASGKSYSQMEYEYALLKGKPTVAFLHGKPGAIPADKTEPTDEGKEKLAAFRKLAETKTVKYWTSPGDLGGKVSRSVAQLIKRHPSEGWVRASEAKEAAAPEILQLRRTIDELQRKIDRAGQQRPVGSEQLAQGEDEFTLNFDVGFADQDGLIVYESQYYIEASWNEIFRLIGPYMITSASESELQRVLERGYQGDLAEIAKSAEDWKAFEDTELRAVNLDAADLKTIIVQLRALGLITHQGAYFTLTPLGDQVMTQLRAIRKPQPETKPKLTTAPDDVSKAG